jgi:hypothetical protein
MLTSPLRRSNFTPERTPAAPRVLSDVALKPAHRCPFPLRRVLLRVQGRAARRPRAGLSEVLEREPQRPCSEVPTGQTSIRIRTVVLELIVRSDMSSVIIVSPRPSCPGSWRSPCLRDARSRGESNGMRASSPGPTEVLVVAVPVGTTAPVTWSGSRSKITPARTSARHQRMAPPPRRPSRTTLEDSSCASPVSRSRFV